MASILFWPQGNKTQIIHWIYIIYLFIKKNIFVISLCGYFVERNGKVTCNILWRTDTQRDIMCLAVIYVWLADMNFQLYVYLTHWPLGDFLEIFDMQFSHWCYQFMDGVIALEIADRCLSQDFTDDKSILVEVMAWCRQATSHYPSQCCPRSLLPYSVTRPQWVNPSGVEYIVSNTKMYLHFLP